MSDLAERVEDVRGWALSRIRHCREQETKFGRAWEHREKHSLGPPQALVEAWTERRALQVVLEMLSPGYLERIDAMATPLTGADLAEKHGFKPHGRDPLTGGVLPSSEEKL